MRRRVRASCCMFSTQLQTCPSRLKSRWPSGCCCAAACSAPAPCLPAQAKAAATAARRAGKAASDVMSAEAVQVQVRHMPGGQLMLPHLPAACCVPAPRAQAESIMRPACIAWLQGRRGAPQAEAAAHRGAEEEGWMERYRLAGEYAPRQPPQQQPAATAMAAAQQLADAVQQQLELPASVDSRQACPAAEPWPEPAGARCAGQLGACWGLMCNGGCAHHTRAPVHPLPAATLLRQCLQAVPR